MGFPIKNGGSFHSYVSLPEGNQQQTLRSASPCEWSLSVAVQGSGSATAGENPEFFRALPRWVPHHFPRFSHLKMGISHFHMSWPQFDLGPPRFLRQGLFGAYAKIRFENLALVIFWKSGCFFHLPFLPAKHMNHTIQFAFKIIVSHQEKQEFEDLRTKQNSLLAWMIF